MGHIWGLPEHTPEDHATQEVSALRYYGWTALNKKGEVPAPEQPLM